MARFRWTPIAVAALALGACSSPVTMSADYAAGEPRTGGKPVPLSGCQVRISQIADSRLDPTTIGLVAGRVVHGPADPQAWIQNALSSLRKSGIELSFAVDGAPSQPSGLTASVTLVTAWVSSAATSKIANIVLDVRYARDGAVLKQASYRGSASAINWWSSGGEIQEVIDDSLAQILGAMTVDLAAICASA
jgi:hypothetical protein